MSDRLMMYISGVLLGIAIDYIEHHEYFLAFLIIIASLLGWFIKNDQ